MERMMAEVGAYEAKTHFAALLDRVEKGEHVAITRHGHAPHNPRACFNGAAFT